MRPSANLSPSQDGCHINVNVSRRVDCLRYEMNEMCAVQSMEICAEVCDQSVSVVSEKGHVCFHV